MPWAGPWWRTVTAQVIGPVTLARRNAGGARGAAPAATPRARPARNVSTTVHPSMLALGLLRGPTAVYGARAHGACASVRDACAPL
jgi:hypothetical protein